MRAMIGKIIRVDRGLTHPDLDNRYSGQAQAPCLTAPGSVLRLPMPERTNVPILPRLIGARP
jgi:hypothetical protein